MRNFRLRSLMLILTTAFNRRWLLHPGQVTLKAYVGFVAIVAAGLIVSGFPPPMIAFVLTLALAMLTTLRLGRFGFTRSDVATLLAILFVGTMILLPEMELTRFRTAGGRYFPRPVPARFMALFQGEQVREPF
jgi:hypothetical protein